MRHLQLCFALASALVLPARSANADVPESAVSNQDHGTDDRSSPPTQAQPPAVADEGYPTALRDRPLTLPQGTLEATPSFEHHVFPWGYFGGSATLFTLAANYGITDELEIGARSALLLTPEVELPGGLAVHAAYAAYRNERVQLAPRIEAVMVPGDEVWLPLVVLGSDTRIAATDTLFLHVGQRLLPINVAEQALSVDLNLGVGIQASSSFALLLDAQVASIAVMGEYNETTHLGSTWFLEATGLYGISERADIFVQAGFLNVTAGLNIRL